MTPAPLLSVSALSAGWTRPVCQPISFTLAAGVPVEARPVSEADALASEAADAPAVNTPGWRGEIVGIGGPNGAGKSTLLAAIAGSAHVFAGGVERRPGLRLAHQTQMSPAFAGVPFSGADLLALTGASADGLPPWLAPLLRKRLDQLSGGQRQFLHLWACLHAPADLVMLDEPTNNLDPAGVAALELALHRRAAEGVGLLVVSHDARFIAAVCDRVLTLEPLPEGATEEAGAMQAQREAMAPKTPSPVSDDALARTARPPAVVRSEPPARGTAGDAS
ncbi:ABC transporter ATP-binding protein [Rhodocyclus gracilis]|uniref:ATP-binding cassette domain-containing protein n=1 Tax=Rhodocyclus gracilis TaxID=2929842 RepID=UPI0030FF1C53